jgi:bifunctional non-homologous end joining protein LigD
MLAKETDQPFDNKDWVFEIKWDGYRAIAEVNKSKVKFYSRNGNSFELNYPIVFDELKKLGINAVLDGEVVVMNESGIPSFQLLQHYQTNPEYPIEYYVFDILKLDGKDLTKLPLIERKKILKKVLKKNDVIRYSDHVKESGIDFFQSAISKNLEGIIAKKANSLYHPGVRTAEWLKIKHHHTGEAIIVGFTEPTGARKHFGALVLALKKGDQLIYAGHTGTGFSDQMLKEMYQLLKPLITSQSPFKERVQTNMPVTWVKPKLVCELKFTEVTRDGKMRHPVFLRLRNDKSAKEATMKQAAEVVKKPSKTPKNELKKNVSQTKSAGADQNKMVKIGGHELKLTNLQKVFWPEEGYTKGDVITYYQNVSKFILPYLKNRPQSLFRTPNGINDKGFFQKDAGDAAPDWVQSIEIFSESANKDIDYILCNNQATLTYLNNLGCIEINPWHSTIKNLDKPDYIVIDIDPSPKNTFEQVIETARAVHEVLKKAGADAYCKTSGATGMHVYIPTQKKYTYDQVKDFAELICLFTNELVPNFTSMERNLKKRGNMIYLDHLQNRRGQTISTVYSLRPKPGATVSTPLDWNEVKPGLTPFDFNLTTILKRLEKKGDLFSGILGKGIDLKKCLRALEK